MRKILLFCLGLLAVCTWFPNTGEAAEERVLLVYDSLNLADSGEKNIDSLQRLLTSMGVKVDTVQDKDYLDNMLRDDVYTAVISFSNWTEKGIQSESFKKDRQAFSGSKLHIGMNVDADEEKLFNGEFRQLSHRQYTLIQQQDFYEQQLDYLDQSLILDTSEGAIFGTLMTQELETKEYPFGVVQGKNAFLPMYSQSGAIFLQSTELIQQWLGKTNTYEPLLTFKSFSPLNDMKIAEDFVTEINRRAVYYVLSSTSTYQNNDLIVYNVFTNILDKAQESGLIFLSVPAVNSANTNDGRILNTIMEETISLLVSNSLYPVGISAPGYWNQDTQYRTDGLTYGKTIILEENPSTENIHYRVEDDRAAIYDTASIHWMPLT